MKPGFYNTGQTIDGNDQPKGYNCHVTRYEKHFLFPATAIYSFELTDTHPLFFVHPDGRWIQPNRAFETDQGSVPALVQLFIPKDRYLGFYFHDSGYASKGLWVSHNGGKTWVFDPMTRRQVDELLKLMVPLDPVPGSKLEATNIWLGVRLGGWVSFGKGDLKKRRKV